MYHGSCISIEVIYANFQLPDMKVPRFVCKFSVQGKEFSADASSKKIAKQVVLHVLLS